MVIEFLLIIIIFKKRWRWSYRNKKTSKRNGKVVGAVNVTENDQIIMITNKGKTIKIAVNDMPIMEEIHKVLDCKCYRMMKSLWLYQQKLL